MRSSVKAFAVFLLSLVCFMMLSCDNNVYIDDPLNHSHSKKNLIKVSEKAATCKEDGNHTYYYCKIEGCDKWFWDIKGERLIENHDDVIIPALEHKDILIHTPAKDATCTEKGNIEFWYCPYCNEKFKDQAGTIATTQTDIPALGHNTGSWVTSETDVHYKVCSVCLDHIDEGLHEFTEWTKISDSPVMYERECTVCHRVEEDSHAQHTMEHHEYNEETCTEDGNIEYWYCVVCQEYYSDANAQTEITQEQTVIPHHILSDWQYGENTHWKICPEDGKVFEASHTWGEPQICEDGNHQIRICTVCGAIKNEDVPVEETYEVAIGTITHELLEQSPCGDMAVNGNKVESKASGTIEGSEVEISYLPHLNSNTHYSLSCYYIKNGMPSFLNAENGKFRFTRDPNYEYLIVLQAGNEGGTISMEYTIKRN